MSDNNNAAGVIRQLDELTAGQIAAGEVVERPVSVVKELVENAIDAGAKHITVRLFADDAHQYINTIQVADDGCGMLPADLQAAFGRHATSKLASADDLNSLLTLGFRGEALPSVAAVSRVQIVSLPRGAAVAHAVLAADGRVDDQGEAVLAAGTRVTVSDLFYNTPARRKFMKSYAVETGYVSKLLGDLILSRPDIAFELEIDGRGVLRSPGAGRPDKALLAVYGSEVLGNMRPVMQNLGDVAVRGFASMPPFARSSRRYYHFFVNGRLVKSDELNAMVDDAYLSLLPEHKYPLCVLYIGLPPATIDVNVHPAKTEIRLRKPQAVREALLAALKAALTLQAQPAPVADTVDTAKTDADESADATALLFEILGKHRVDSVADEQLQAAEDVLDLQSDPDELMTAPVDTPKPEAAPLDVPDLANLSGEDMKNMLANQNDEPDFANKLFQSLIAASGGQKREYARDDGDWLAENFGITYMENYESKPQTLFDEQKSNLFLALKPLGQLNNSYIIATLGEDLYIIDQHAAHERILYEEFTLAFDLDSRETSMLAVPQQVEVGSLHAELLLNNIVRLADFGFVVEPFGEGRFVVRGVPLWYVRGAESTHKKKSQIYDNDIAGFFLDVLDMLMESPDTEPDIGKLNKLELFTKACKSAIKANEKLNGQEISWLLYNLAECEKPQTCPHGRPTFIKLTDAEIRRRFMRS